MTDAVAFAQYKAKLVTDLINTHHLPHDTIFDIYAGDGLMTYYLQQYIPAAKVIGYENNEEKHLEATTLNQDITFLYSECLNDLAPFKTDIVVLSLALHHVPDVYQTLHTALHHFNPTTFIIIEFNPYRPDIQWLRFSDPEERDAQFITPRTLKKIGGKLNLKAIALNWHLHPYIEDNTFYWLKKVPTGALYTLVLKH